MKKKLFIVMTLVIIICLSAILISCDKNNDNSKIEYVQDRDYLKIWYDETWFPNLIHVEFYYGDNYLSQIEEGDLIGQRLASFEYNNIFAPNTWIYVFEFSAKYMKNYEYITVKICSGRSADYVSEKIVLAEYTIYAE